MFRISRYKDADKESVTITPIELENNDEIVKTICIEIDGKEENNDFTFRFMLSDLKKIFNINEDEKVCLDEDYLLSEETMFTYNGVTDLNTECDIDVYRESENVFDFYIGFNAEDGSGSISIECDLKDYLE